MFNCGGSKWIELESINAIEFTKKGNITLLIGAGFQCPISEIDFLNNEAYLAWQERLKKEKGLK